MHATPVCVVVVIVFVVDVEMLFRQTQIGTQPDLGIEPRSSHISDRCAADCATGGQSHSDIARGARVLTKNIYKNSVNLIYIYVSNVFIKFW